RDAVRPDLARVVHLDRQPGTYARLEDHGRNRREMAMQHRPPFGENGRHGRTHHDALEAVEFVADQAAQQDRPFVAGPAVIGLDQPMPADDTVIQNAENGVRIADIDGQDAHQPACKSRPMSKTFTECVRAPTEIQSTPVSATPRARSKVRPPLASRIARPAVICTASVSCASVMLSSRIRSQPTSSSSRSSCSEPTSTSIGRSGHISLTASYAGTTPPAATTWLSFTSAMSDSDIRWLCPPPARTAYFSSAR